MNTWIEKLKAWQTKIAGIGLLGLCVYHLSVGQFENAGQAFLLALTALGLGQQLERQERQLRFMYRAIPKKPE